MIVFMSIEIKLDLVALMQQAFDRSLVSLCFKKYLLHDPPPHYLKNVLTDSQISEGYQKGNLS